VVSDFVELQFLGLSQDEVNEEIEEIVANDQISNISKYPDDELYVGLKFTCIEDGKKFYNDYAFKMGFSIRKQTHYKARKHDDAITSMTYCCSKADSHTPKKDCPNRQTNCKAHIVLKVDDRGKWVITVVANEHNHELIASPSKTRFFRSHRNMTTEQKNLIHMLNEQNISASQIMSFLEAKEGGRHNIHFIRKDLMDEFENAWATMIDKYQLHENNHLRLLWNIRYQWIPVYFRDTFFANMSISQRSESMNAVAKIWLDSHTSMFKFVTQFEKMSNNQYEREDMEDFMTNDGEPSLWSDDPIEKNARSIYTRTIFSEFKVQLRATTGYKLVELEKDKLYKISSISQPSTSKQRMCTYTVTVVRSDNIVSCTCKSFEFYGLLCAHALKVMHHIEVYSIPSRYILKRWTKNAKKVTSTNSLEMSDGSSFCRSRRFDLLTLESQKFIFEGSKSLKAYDNACRIIKEGLDVLTSINKTIEMDEGTNKEPSNDLHRTLISQSSFNQYTIKDPPHSQCKRRRKPQRIKPPVEKKARISRTCKQCGKKGDNIRTCKEVVAKIESWPSRYIYTKLAYLHKNLPSITYTKW
ncbi:Protein FAR1-RELATED SEQUENCE 5, partial [Ananas comosus]